MEYAEEIQVTITSCVDLGIEQEYNNKKYLKEKNWPMGS
jgi:hypothetical protein